MDITRATELSDEVKDSVRDMFMYHPWSSEQVIRGGRVRDALMEAVMTIIENVPPSPDRTVAIRKLRDARMDCNSAITHGGKY